MDASTRQTAEELDKCRQELLASRDALRDTEEKLRRSEEELRSSEEALADMKEALRETEEKLKSREAGLRSSQEVLAHMKVQTRETSEALEEALTTVSHQEAELTRVRGVLRASWQEGDQIAARIAERRLCSEDAMSRTQREAVGRVEELKTELGSLKEFTRELQQDHAALTEVLKEERALVFSLSALLQREKSESAERMRDLEDEMEEVLGQLAALEEQEQRWRDALAERQGALLSLRRDHAELETELNETRALLECRRRSEMNRHSMAMESLQEQHAYSQHAVGEHQACCGTSRGQQHSTGGGHCV